HYAHAQLQQTQCIPLALWAFHKLLDTRRVRDGVVLGLAIAGQMLSCMYYGLFLIPYMAVVCGTILVARKAVTKQMIVALALVALWPPLSATRIAYALGLLIAFDVSLGFNGIVYRALYDYFLPFRALRIPARMGIMVGFSLAVLAGYGAARIGEMMPQR